MITAFALALSVGAAACRGNDTGGNGVGPHEPGASTAPGWSNQIHRVAGDRTPNVHLVGTSASDFGGKPSPGIPRTAGNISESNRGR